MSLTRELPEACVEPDRGRTPCAGSPPRAKYPLFTDPRKYLRIREKAHGLGGLKRWAERRALSLCLRDADARTLCDAPCGPGRLFPFWGKWVDAIVAVELSDPMVEAATERLCRLSLAGEVRKGDVFTLRQHLDEPADVVACVRFAYYFERDGRVALLKSLAAASRRHVLVQYKSIETRKGRRNARRAERKHKNGHAPKYFCTNDGIREELAAAGLACLRIAPIGQSSDRVFVLGEKTAT